MIDGDDFRHKPLGRFWTKGDLQGLPNAHAKRLLRILLALNAAAGPEDLNLASYHLHPLKGDRKGEWSIRLYENWCITFRFEGSDVTDINLEDYH